MGSGVPEEGRKKSHLFRQFINLTRLRAKQVINSRRRIVYQGCESVSVERHSSLSSVRDFEESAKNRVYSVFVVLRLANASPLGPRRSLKRQVADAILEQRHDSVYSLWPARHREQRLFRRGPRHAGPLEEYPPDAKDQALQLNAA